ncbi:MAG: phosphate signaling complex protein PhoU [Steroidobacteraceae bacterium]
MNTAIDGDPTEGHTSKTLDHVLAELRLNTVTMGGLVIDQVGTAVRALLNANSAAAQQVLSREFNVNELERDIDRDAFQLIARHQLVAGDLRLARAITRIIHELERAGDEAKKIARFAQQLVDGTPQGPVITVAPYLRHMADLSTSMLREAVRALDESDLELAHRVTARDMELDEEFASALRQVFTLVMEGEPYLRATIDTVFALKGLERIGDHAKNIAEQVVLIIQR